MDFYDPLRLFEQFSSNLLSFFIFDTKWSVKSLKKNDLGYNFNYERGKMNLWKLNKRNIFWHKCIVNSIKEDKHINSITKYVDECISDYYIKGKSMYICFIYL